MAPTATDQLPWSFLVPENVKVMVADGWVTLGGKVRWRFLKGEAETAVRPLLGVKGIVNEISLEPTVIAALFDRGSSAKKQSAPPSRSLVS
jgi:osmotically-inducible protein OsmY